MGDDRKFEIEQLERRVTNIGGIVAIAIAVAVSVVLYNLLPEQIWGRSGFNVAVAMLAFIGIASFLSTHLSK